ncbi:DUF4124 domain-containing protein [Tepidimonas aquatica]|uniref:DUF4124 domain-containing protein n=1 Tax=Tepidimonas aquatica TaxID=247482 RepID=A0A554WWH8_9BURK|nr:DUF4124 domain-containing protein [Tepidimonas aquatica]TSE27932.1 hypothetical protein Taqua_00128 [Tepidimonas aquatica]
MPSRRSPHLLPLIAWHAVAWVGVVLLAGPMAQAQNAPAAVRAPIYTCTDAQGRLLSSDRPIPECSDRVQRELGPSGVVRRVIEPPPAPEQRERLAAQQRAQAEAAAQAAEQQRREQLLLMRYPDEAAHQRARETALAQLHASLQAAQQHLQRLDDEARRLQDEMEFYRKDPARAGGPQAPAGQQRQPTPAATAVRR